MHAMSSVDAVFKIIYTAAAILNIRRNNYYKTNPSISISLSLSSRQKRSRSIESSGDEHFII